MKKASVGLTNVNNLIERINKNYQLAEQGDAEAQFQTGKYALTAINRKFTSEKKKLKKYIEGRYWYAEAARQGHEAAKIALKKLIDDYPEFYDKTSEKLYSLTISSKEKPSVAKEPRKTAKKISLSQPTKPTDSSVQIQPLENSLNKLKVAASPKSQSSGATILQNLGVNPNESVSYQDSQYLNVNQSTNTITKNYQPPTQVPFQQNTSSTVEIIGTAVTDHDKYYGETNTHSVGEFIVTSMGHRKGDTFKILHKIGQQYKCIALNCKEIETGDELYLGENDLQIPKHLKQFIPVVERKKLSPLSPLPNKIGSTSTTTYPVQASQSQLPSPEPIIYYPSLTPRGAGIAK